MKRCWRVVVDAPTMEKRHEVFVEAIDETDAKRQAARTAIIGDRRGAGVSVGAGAGHNGYVWPSARAEQARTPALVADVAAYATAVPCAT